MDELKPCPFCGGAALHRTYSSEYWVVCTTCLAQTKAFDDPADALDAWNRRAKPTMDAMPLSETELEPKQPAFGAMH